jgi:predicted nucleic acid-binding protein
MATGAVDPSFIDTNVLVYATVPVSPLHAAAVAALAAERAAGRPLWVSRQVLREYLAVLSRPNVFNPSFSAAQLVQQVLALQALFLVAEDSAAVTANLLNLLTTVPVGGKQVHDANIVATMQAYNIPRLLTHNTADFARFASVITVVPLVP